MQEPFPPYKNQPHGFWLENGPGDEAYLFCADRGGAQPVPCGFKGLKVLPGKEPAFFERR